MSHPRERAGPSVPVPPQRRTYPMQECLRDGQRPPGCIPRPRCQPLPRVPDGTGTQSRIVAPPSPAAQLGVCSPSGAAQPPLTPLPPRGRPRPGRGVTEMWDRHTHTPHNGCGTHRDGGSVAGGGHGRGSSSGAELRNTFHAARCQAARGGEGGLGTTINRCCYHWRGHCCSLQRPAPPPGWESVPPAPLLCLPCPQCGQTPHRQSPAAPLRPSLL